MNTIEKGDILENNSLAIIQKLIQEGLFGIKEYVKVFKKKKYPSKIRNIGSVEFDLSVEIWPPNAKRFLLVYFIECKNYKTRVPIDKVKKFHSDIIETSGVNAKGIFISATALQKGAYDYASVQGMMIIEGQSADDYKIILYKTNIPKIDTIPFIKETFDQTLIDEGVQAMEKIIDKQILKSLKISTSNISFGIDKLSKKKIDLIAKNELNNIGTKYLRSGFGLQKKTIIEYIKKEYGIKVISFNSDDNLGTCDINNKTIGLNNTIIGTSRELFILCHELGHFILHQNLSINQELLDSFSDTERNFVNRKVSLDNPKQWIEWQANYFAVSFLLPESSIMATLWKTQQRMDLEKGNLIINDNNHYEYYKIIKKLAYHFETSQTSIVFRLKEFGLISNESRLKSIGELIEMYKGDIFS
jgi:Zn-dependent peptidase ImmA (M78 family)